MTEQKLRSDKSDHKILRSLTALALKIVLPVVIVALAVGFYKHQMDTRPKAQRRPPEREARLVAVQTAQTTEARATIPAMGTVSPARRITLSPEVTGVITRIDPAVVPGGLVKAGQVLYEIDSRDYEAIVKQRESEVAAAQLQLKLESGSQAVAQQEYELLEEMIREEEKELVLRQPQLESARQALAAAQASLDKARLDVERCSIRAPFNAVINAKHADLGARVSPTSSLAELTGTDEFWVDVLVPVNQLGWIQVPTHNGQARSPVRIYSPAAWGSQAYREGHIIRLQSELEEQGRMARLLAAVPDPLHLQGHDSLPPLLIGSYVRVEILGGQITGVIALPREHLRDGSRVWIMNEQNKLEIRPVEIRFRNRETVFVSEGIRDGERIVTSNLATPVEGMPLRTEGMKSPDTAVAGSAPSEDRR